MYLKVDTTEEMFGAPSVKKNDYLKLTF
jgi:hypothetical protein